MKHIIKCINWPMSPGPHMDFNAYIKTGTILRYSECSDGAGNSWYNWSTCYGHGNKVVPTEFIDYYPECFIELEKEDLDKLKSYPDAKLIRYCYTGNEAHGVWIGRQFIHD